VLSSEGPELATWSDDSADRPTSLGPNVFADLLIESAEHSDGTLKNADLDTRVCAIVLAYPSHEYFE
jgi:hypothetical protein